MQARRVFNWYKMEAIHKYVEATSYDGGMTRGEKGILIQHNLKWLRLF